MLPNILISWLILILIPHRLVFAYITYIEVKYPLYGERSAPGSPWPIPQRWTRFGQTLLVRPKSWGLLRGASDKELECDVINKALKRYNRIIAEITDGSAVDSIDDSNTQYKSQYTANIVSEVSVSVNQVECHSDTYPALGDDESYSIAIHSRDRQNAVITANTIWGAIRAVDTFSQLLYKDYKTNNTLVNATMIDDWPRFSYRGLLLDTARHYIPVDVLLLNLDAMAYNKMNVFHWHIVDDQSFPFESKLFKNLTQLNAYSPEHVYSQRDIKRIISEARLRGIRVIPEIDTPGHTQAFGKAFPNLLTLCYDSNGEPNVTVYGKHSGTEILNPIQNFTYDFFKQFYQEVKSVFADQFIHLGMDEVYYECWESNPDIKKFMHDMNMTKTAQLEQYYVKKTLDNVKSIGYKYMTWQDPVDNGVEMSPDSVVQLWKDRELGMAYKPWGDYIKPIAKKGYKMVLSSCWYLNYISYGQDWKKYYNCDPHNFTGTTEEKNLIIGGEACLWSEYVDGTNLLARLWPRASAVAEKLWSSAKDTTDNTDNAQFRLDEHRCRMLRRGIPAQPILNGFCGDYEWNIVNRKTYDKNLDSTTSYSYNPFQRHYYSHPIVDYIISVNFILIIVNVY